MLTAEELHKLAMRFGIPMGVVEKDYMLTSFLHNLSSLTKNLTFKGGTAIKKVYLATSRFSEDLDFTAMRKQDFEKLLRRAGEGIGFELKSVVKGKKSFSASVQYRGPLNHPSSVLVEISSRERLLLPRKVMPVIHPYPDISRFGFPTMHVKEIVAEKLRAAYMRGDPRDFFDLYQLARNFHLANVRGLFFKKLRNLGVKFEGGRLRGWLEGTDVDRIGYLIPSEIKIDGEELKATLRRTFAFAL
ncbi:MAG: nucleotidyl transferase AbiEii/AbiGii toxin family protein [Candidatus Hodarchaeaceae archaeon]|nr:nucleotidyl transferase AbiEii/AbiGii toxin family protein [Candidatus Hodarchaeaceae archaeon]